MKIMIKEKISAFLSEIKSRSQDRRLLKEIKNGFNNNEFKMYLQFVVDNKSGRISSAEALSRWESASGEVVPPVKYIGLMEKYGLISRLDYYMFEMTCAKLSQWKETEFSDISVSCNFTRLTISDEDFVAKIKDISDRYDFDRRKLIIEITEDSVEKNLAVAMENIRKAKELGFRIALDDIGSGYTSLISLCEYSLDIVKIDRNILQLADNDLGKKLFSGIVSMVHNLNLNLEVVCEGVETEEQNAFVNGSDCDYIQGWYYSKVLPEEKAEAFAKEYIKNH